MHQICKKLCRKYAENMPLHKLQHSKNMQIICKKNMQKNMLNMQQKYAKICKNMQNMHKSMCWHILNIYALPTLLMVS